MALSGDTLAVGSRRPASGVGAGAVSLFHYDRASRSWILTSTLTGDGEFGVSLGLDGNTLVAGAFADDGERGLARLFQRADPLTWTELLPPLQASDPSAADRFGYAVAVSGNAIAVGAYQDDSPARQGGSVYFFTPPSIETPPVANPDAFSGLEDSLLSGNVRGNDLDTDADLLSAMLVDAPTHHQSAAGLARDAAQPWRTARGCPLFSVTLATIFACTV